MTGKVEIARADPRAPDFAELFRRHTAQMHAQSPPESIHMMDAGRLAVPEIAFYGMRRDGIVVGMGAWKRLDAEHAEIKSMHVLSEMRGSGLARRMLDHLLAEAAAAGMRRASLETGSQETFLPARTLYSRAGFELCPPFGSYAADPNSVFMTRTL